MRIMQNRNPAVFFIAIGLLIFLSVWGFGAAVETPTGKRIPGRIVDEEEETYKVGTDLPGGGRIIFNVEKEKVDPHGAVPGRGRIEDIRGRAQIKRVGIPRFVTASKYMSVNPGDEIRTGGDSEVVLTLETTAVNGIGKNTHCTLDSFEINPETDATQIKIGLAEGELWSEVGRLKTKDSSFQVETPTAVTGVRGTVFLVEVAKATAETSVSVVTGRVAVGSKDVDVPEVVLRKKEAVSVKAGEEPQKLTPSELLTRIVKTLEKWARTSEHFTSVTALAGVGQIEEIEVEPGLSEAQRQLVYDEIQAGWGKASEDYYQIDKALKFFYMDFARFPTVEEGGLNVLVHSTGTPQWNGPYTEAQYLNDHYGVPYGYAVLRDIHGNVYAQITTFGYDKRPGTKDDRRKIILEEDARRWGDKKNYR